MYIDFTDLNKECSKHHYPLPSIDKLVDSTSRHSVVFLFNTILGYHQILMESENAKNPTFITDDGVLFRLKNAGHRIKGS